MKRKTVLVDTVDHRFTEPFLLGNEMEIDINDIDTSFVQHAEENHSVPLPRYLLRSLIRLSTVRSGCELDCRPSSPARLELQNGKKLATHWISLMVATLSLFEMKMLHWPDSMATYDWR
ncbi:hypothetical protein OK016_28445 [Vibrio chagasii]|nr:hypothetical protein [Vibrio chagasii]